MIGSTHFRHHGPVLLTRAPERNEGPLLPTQPTALTLAQLTPAPVPKAPRRTVMAPPRATVRACRAVIIRLGTERPG
jgi:hypothetical protein